MKIEAMGVKYDNASLLSAEEQRAIDIVERTTCFTGERYEAGLPWKDDNISLPSNREVAFRMLQSVERRNAKDPVYAARYDDIMMDSVRLGFAREVAEEELQIQHPREWYIIHHGVKHPHKPGHLRVVFNESFEYKGISLNKSLARPEFAERSHRLPYKIPPKTNRCHRGYCQNVLSNWSYEERPAISSLPLEDTRKQGPSPHFPNDGAAVRRCFFSIRLHTHSSSSRKRFQPTVS